MQTPDQENQDIDQQIEEMKKSVSDLRASCHSNSAYRLAGDLLRLTRREQRLIPMLRAQFELVNLAQDLFQHHRGREVAIDMIALLESPDRARQIQADFSEREYAESRAWMTACAYDNLAEHTAEIHGFNSEGMHQCITDGIEVCRRTGKLRCITCFREYASDVYMAADDIDMALHFARMGLAVPEDSSDNDRRWVSAQDASVILFLTGELAEAEEMCRRALELAQSYHSPQSARIRSHNVLEQLLWLVGRGDEFEKITGEKCGSRVLPAGENPAFDHRWDLRDAFTACCRSETDKAIELLSQWDAKLVRDKILHEWFETRLRLIAAHRFAGKQEKVDALAQPLFKAAQKARDWLTVRRLRRLLDPAEPPTPNAMLASPRVGPFAPAGVTTPASVPDAAPTGGDSAQPVQANEPIPTPLGSVFQQLVERLQSSEVTDALKVETLQQVLELPSDAFVHPADAGAFLSMVTFVVTDVSTFERVWAWAEAVASRFPQHAGVVNLLATLADVLTGWPDSTMSERIETKRIEALFRQSLDLDPESAPNHARAAAFYLGQQNLGEAERCLARGFRLSRDNSYLALRLADIYQRTDRPRDALAVLDLCLREGCADPSVAWEAIMLANRLEQFESLLTYLDRFESLNPDQPWVGYFRAIGLLELAQPEQALEALALEERRSPERPFGIEILRACAASALGQPQRYRQHLERVLAYQWSTVDYFTISGLSNLSARLWTAGSCLPADDEELARLAQRLIRTGLAPGKVFEPRRLAGEVTAKVKHYRCTLFQPLDKRWAESPGCLDGQSAWPSYRCVWGVLARDEDEARRLATAQQAECYDLEASVEEVEDLAQNYTDKPGIIWQGARACDDSEPSDG